MAKDHPLLNMKYLYYEKQKYTPWWLYVLLTAPAAIGWWALIQQIFLNIPYGNNQGSDFIIIIFFIFVSLIFPVILLNTCLVTKFDGQKVELIYFPFWKTSFQLVDIVEVKKRKFNAMAEFGGRGIRWNSKGTIAYIHFKTDEGIEFSLKGGRNVLVSSQKANELLEIMQSSINK